MDHFNKSICLFLLLKRLLEPSFCYYLGGSTSSKELKHSSLLILDPSLNYYS